LGQGGTPPLGEAVSLIADVFERGPPGGTNGVAGGKIGPGPIGSSHLG
jgi:hypothetical protein